MSGAAVAITVARARRRIVEHFTTADATAPQRAVAFTPGKRPMDSRMWRRLRDFGAVVETTPGLFYLDLLRLEDFRSSMRRRALGILGVMAAVIGAAVAIGS